MYNNIGKKIKGLAVGTFIVETIGSVITALILMALDEDTFYMIGLPTLFGGPLVAWISSWILYGFGELIDKITAIERNTRGNVAKSEVQTRVENERITKLEKLRSQGLITEEEYQKALSNN